MSQPADWQNLRERLTPLLREEPRVLDFGFAPLPAETAGSGLLDRWLSQGFQADMAWMDRTAAMRKHPLGAWEKMQSALVALWRYPQPLKAQPDWISSYAQGMDYHQQIGNVLRSWSSLLSQGENAYNTRPFVDSLPLPERSLAVAAGLGFIGRNGMFIHPRHGSAFFIAGLLLDTPCPEMPRVLPFAHGCATCNRCQNACPSEAIGEEGLVDSRRCASYLTIEHRGAFSKDQQADCSHTLFGCDLCQSVCPYNKRHLGETAPYWPISLEDWVKKAPKGEGLARMLRGTPLERTGRPGMLRNLAAWARNHGQPEIAEELECLLAEP